MAKFIYRMQNILDVKLKLETQAKNEFAIANARLREEEEKLEELKARQEGYADDLRRLYSTGLDVAKMRELKESIDTMNFLIDDQLIVIRQAEREVEVKRAALAEAMLERKTHEKLKERQFEQFMLDLAAEESKEIDELVSYRFGQK